MDGSMHCHASGWPPMGPQQVGVPGCAAASAAVIRPCSAWVVQLTLSLTWGCGSRHCTLPGCACCACIIRCLGSWAAFRRTGWCVAQHQTLQVLPVRERGTVGDDPVCSWCRERGGLWWMTSHHQACQQTLFHCSLRKDLSACGSHRCCASAAQWSTVHTLW